MPQNNAPRRSTGRKATLLLLLSLAIIAPFGGAGCAPGGPFGPQTPVAADPQQALKDGENKEKLALDADKIGSKTEAKTLWTSAATYYGAAARKYDGQTTGLIATMAGARIEAEHLDQLQQSYTQLRAAVHKYPVGSLGTSTLPNDLQTQYQQVITLLDKKNSDTYFYKVMDALVKIAGGNAVLALFMVAVAVCLLTWPLRKQVLVQANEMKRYMPEMKKLQDKYKGDMMLYSEKMREFNQKHGINQMAGCLPALAQLPITYLMYQVIQHYQFHFQNDHFLWINKTLGEASMNWPAPLKGAIAHNLSESDLFLMVAYAMSMFFQMRFTPASSPDPQQVETQKQMAFMMPLMFFVFMYNGQWASAFVLYWFMSNIMTLGQQWIINRSLPKVDVLVLDENGDPVNGSKPSPALAPNPRLISPKNSRKK